MIKVSEVVEEIVRSDDVALEAMRRRALNLSAYAEEIKNEVESATVKDVKNGTIVVALSRFAAKLDADETNKPRVVINDLSIKSPLVELTYEKTEQTLFQVRKIYGSLVERDQAFLTMTHGVNEVTVVIAETLRSEFESRVTSKPKAIYEGLVGITVKFDKKYIEIPNVLHTLIGSLALKRVNLIEVISAYTELTVVVRRGDMEVSVQALNKFFGK